MTMRHTVFLVLMALAAVGLLAVFQRYAPSQHNPFKPLSVDDPIGAATFHKLISLNTDVCYATLDAAGLVYTRLDDTSPSRHCGFYDALTLDRSDAPYSLPLSMTCPMTAALAVWERQVALPAAQRILDSPIKRIETYGSYSCRRVNNAQAGSYSQHATGNAIDISGFTLADGRLISVRTDWGKDTPEGKFLHAVREGACRIYSVVLSPDYNAAHADHFHFDMGGGDLCS